MSWIMNWVFPIVVVVAVIFIKKRLPYWIGKRGEKFVTKNILQLDGAYYRVFEDLLLPSNGSLNTTQIDHVVVSNYGIFCIETKSYKGWIFGNAKDEYWTQIIYRYRKRFYNPLRQNYAHAKAIEELLKYKYPEAPIYSLVAFPDADKLKISGTDSVGFVRDVVEKINSYTKIVLSDIEKDEICKILMMADIKDKESRNFHDQGVKNIKN